MCFRVALYPKYLVSSISYLNASSDGGVWIPSGQNPWSSGSCRKSRSLFRKILAMPSTLPREIFRIPK